MLARDGRHGLLQHAVDAVLDDQRIVVRLKVDVRRAPFERGEDGGVHQADDGADVFFRGELLDRNVFVGILFAGSTSKVRPSVASSSTRCDCSVFLSRSVIWRERGDTGDDALAQQAGDFIDHHQAAGIADGDDQAVLVLLQRNEVVAEHHVHGHGAEQVVLDTEVLQVDELAAIATREHLRAHASSGSSKLRVQCNPYCEYLP